MHGFSRWTVEAQKGCSYHASAAERPDVWLAAGDPVAQDGLLADGEPYNAKVQLQLRVCCELDRRELT